MKDYHDIILMIKEPGLLAPAILSEKLQITFKYRNTTFVVPIKFDAQEVSQLQNLWSNHLRGLGYVRNRLDLPDDMIELLAEINSWLTNILHQKTIDAMQEARYGQLKSFKTVESLTDDLNDGGDYS